MKISTTFNVGDLNPYIEVKDEGIKALRVDPFQAGRLMRSKLYNPTSLITSRPWFTLDHGDL